MKNSKLRRALMLLACAVLLVSLSVGATLAYLTATTGTVTNTFSVGKVTLTLDEAKVDVYGKLVYKMDDQGNPTTTLADRVTENSYKLIPGHDYVKDPTVHIGADSENGWLFVKVVNEISDIENATTIAEQMTTNGWTAVDTTKHPNVYAYKTTVKANDDIKVFESFTLKNDANVAAYAGKKITVQAYLVQADGFDSAAEAWEAAPSNWTAPTT